MYTSKCKNIIFYTYAQHIHTKQLGFFFRTKKCTNQQPGDFQGIAWIASRYNLEVQASRRPKSIPKIVESWQPTGLHCLATHLHHLATHLHHLATHLHHFGMGWIGDQFSADRRYGFVYITYPPNAPEPLFLATCCQWIFLVLVKW